MYFKILLIVLFLPGAVNIFAQSATPTAPVIWQHYKDTAQNISILFPKMPVLKEFGDSCREESLKRYAVYAKGVVYGLNIVSRLPRQPDARCYNKKDFSERNFSDRLNQLKKASKGSAVTKQGFYEYVEKSERGASYWLLNDYRNKRWFEFWTVGQDEIDDDVLQKYLSSLKLENAEGIEIGAGADEIIGDAVADENTIKPRSAVSAPINIIYKDRANYTNVARKKQIEGEVQLEITYGANGGIKNITVLKGLPEGMTESVIVSVKKMVFIPEKKNGFFQTTTKKLFYHFTLL